MRTTKNLTLTDSAGLSFCPGEAWKNARHFIQNMVRQHYIQVSMSPGTHDAARVCEA